MKDCDESVDCSCRREFLAKAAFLTGGLVLTLSGVNKVLGRSFEEVTVTIIDASPLAKVGGSDVVDSSAGKIIILRTGETTFVAYSDRCTHKGGIVEYDAASKQFVCPKHGSKFQSATGAVAQGPANDPLKPYGAKGDKGSVVVNIG